jgi:hypothetical protein
MAENARRALEVRADKPQSQRGMTSVGLARARQLINRQNLSPDVVRRMLSFFQRHEVNKDGSTWDEQGKGWQAWQGWGGDEGFSWARARVRQMDAADKQSEKAHKAAPTAGGNAVVFKDSNGNYRWLAISSSAYEDRDGEIVSKAALTADTIRADETGEYGPLLWWHVPNAELGTCDFNAIDGRYLIESGTFHDPVAGQRLAEKAGEIGVSIGFEHLVWEPDRDGVYSWIRRVERSLLPKHKASNRFTSLTVKETKMTEEQELHLRHLLGEDATGQEALNRLKANMFSAEQTAKQEHIRHKMEGEEDKMEDGGGGMSEADQKTYQMIAMAVAEAISPLVEALEEMKGYDKKETPGESTTDPVAVLQTQVANLQAQIKAMAEAEPLPRAMTGHSASTSKTTLVSEEEANRFREQQNAANGNSPETLISDLLFGKGAM